MKEKVLILGGNGMIGHNLLLNLKNYFDVKVTLRGKQDLYKKFKIFDETNAFYNADALNISTFQNIIGLYKPDYIINAIGVTKQKVDFSKDETFYINGEFPHLIYDIAHAYSKMVVQLSTDCIFSGRKGMYTEKDVPDADDIYGKSKIMGELNYKNALTLRKSTIGFELGENHGLFEWWLNSKNSIYGFNKAIYSGVTTTTLSKLIIKILLNKEKIPGTFHIGSHPISKYELLILLNQIFDKNDLKIIKDEKFECDRSLNGSLFLEKYQIQLPNWNDMLIDLHGERPFYEKHR